MTITPELLELLQSHETVEAVVNAAGLIDSELPEVVKFGRLNPWQRELYRYSCQLKRLHRALSPNTLAAVAAEPARRSNFGNVGKPGPGW